MTTIVLRATATADSHVTPEILAPELYVVRTTPSLAEIGRAAAKAAQRQALLDVLEQTGWSLASTADVLAMSDSNNVRRALHELAPELYEARRDQIQRAPRVEATRAADSFAEVGRIASNRAMRELLLATLERTGWNIQAAAHQLNGGSPANLIRVLQRLAPNEYAAARSVGRRQK